MAIKICLQFFTLVLCSIHLALSHTCSKTDLQIEHGELIDCYYMDFSGPLEEYAEIRCDPGYEIQSNIFTLSVLLDKQNAYLKSPVICKPSNNRFCSSVYPIPKDYDKSNISFVNVGSMVNSQYRVGTKINFICNKGYYYYGSGDLSTYCLENGQWSKVPDCKCILRCYFSILFLKSVLFLCRRVTSVLEGCARATTERTERCLFGIKQGHW